MPSLNIRRNDMVKILAGSDRGRTAEVARLGVQQRRADERLDQRVDRRRGEVIEQDSVARVGQREVGIHVDQAQLARWHHRDGVELGTEGAQRLDERRTVALAADEGRLDWRSSTPRR